MSDAPTKYFDLHTTGIGYLNRARIIKPQRGDEFVAVDIAALHGDAENVQYTRFDCRVTGKDAQLIVRQAIADIENDRRVLVGFKLSDLYAETFTYKNGERAGETGISLKARLIRIHWVKVDGETVYTAPPAAEQAA